MERIFNETGIVLDDNDSIEKNLKEKEYLDYINDHIEKVKECFANYIIPLMNINNISSLLSDEEIKENIIIVAKRIGDHDASKFSDDEFDGYRAKWHPTLKELDAGEEYKELMMERYEECWKHHYTNNPHHPKYWYNEEDNTCKDMALDAIIEMICDWEAMSLKFNTDTVEWYNNKAEDEKRCMSAKTKEIVEEFFNILH